MIGNGWQVTVGPVVPAHVLSGSLVIVGRFRYCRCPVVARA